MIVDDEDLVIRVVRRFLSADGYTQFVTLTDPREALEAICREEPDVVLLDWMLPGTDGIAYAGRLKSHPLTRDIPIIMVTAKTEERDKVRGLDCGADDYITKPFSTSELLARIRAAVRRTKPQQSGERIELGVLSIDPEGHTLKIGDQLVDIGLKEFALLYLFLRKPDRVYSRSQLLDKIWGKDSYVDERTVDVYIRRLRSVLEQHGHPNLIKTIRGVGYRLASG